MKLLKQSTTVTVQMGPAVDATDGVTPETVLTPTVYLTKNGAAQAVRNSATAITHDRDGYYRVELNATDTGTLGRLRAQFSDSATHVPVWEDYMVLTANAFDSLVAGTDTLETVLTAAGVDAIFDEPIVGHLTAGTTGFYLSIAGGVLVDTTITGTPTSTTFQLTAGSSIDDYYDDQLIYILSGAGLGQVRTMLSYIGATKTVVVDEPWITVPVATDRVVITSSHVHPLSQIKSGLVIPKNAAFSDLEFLMVQAVDGRTPATGLTVTGERSINGGAFAAISGSIAEVSNGIYQVDLLAADTNGDVITYKFSAVTADDTFITVMTA